MGLCGSNEKNGGSSKGGWPKDGTRDRTFKWSYDIKQHPLVDKDKKIKDPDHYKASGLKNEVWSRGPQTINGDQIQISDSENCDFFLCDEMDSLVVDNCKDCRFFSGPASGSAFLRNCTDCKVVIACGQLRLRDCKDVDISIYCSSKPVIESSKRISFCCFDGYYFNLKEQFDRAKLSVFNNRWSDIHDFTPNKLNYEYNKPTTKMLDLIKPLSVGIPDLISGEEEANANQEMVVPKTWGLRDMPKEGEHGVVVFLSNQAEACTVFLQQLNSKHPNVNLIHTKESIIGLKDAQEIFAQSSLSSAAKEAVVKGPTIAVGVFGPEAMDVCKRLVQSNDQYYLPASVGEANFLYAQMFEQHQLGGDFKS